MTDAAGTSKTTTAGCPSKAQLSAFNVGQASEADEAYIEHHIETCQSCLATLNELQDQANAEGLDAQLRQIVAALPEADQNATQSIAQPADAPTLSVAPANTPRASSGLVGKMIGQYRVLEELGHGGMGVVVLAEHATSKHRIAIKMLRERHAPHPIMLERFHKECAALVRLTEREHPHIVRLLYVDQYEGSPYFAMEYMEGRTLAKQLRLDRMSPRGAVQWVRTIAEAIAEAHACQVLHRDLKPANIFIDRQGRIKVADFGLAKLLDDDGQNAQTMTNDVLGTPAYMAPEQALGQSKQTDERTDVYGLGAILYECLTGKPPFTGPDPQTIREKVIKRRPIPPVDLVPTLPLALEAICLKCLEKDPNRRYPSAAALVADLTLWLDQGTSAATPTRAQRVVRRLERLAIPLSFVAAAIMLTGALHYTDPTRPVANIQRQLSRSQTVTLLTPDSPKPWYRIRTGHTGTKVVENADGSITVMSYGGTALVEIVPAVPVKHFTVEATIRHEKSNNVGYVGLYVAHRRFPGATAEGHHLFAALVYNDVIPESSYAMNLPPEIAKNVNPSPLNPVYWGVGTVGERRSLKQYSVQPTAYRGARFVPVGVVGNAWRRLAIQIDPEQLVGYRDDELVGRCTNDSFVGQQQSAVGLLLEKTPDDSTLQDIEPSDAKQGGIGFFVMNGNATFKNVVITPRGD